MSVPRAPRPWSEGFYLPPDPLPRGRPGDVLRAEPMDAYLVPGVRLRARAWRLLYRSTGAVGERTAVSGALLLPPRPRRDGRPTPLVGFAIGTHGIGDGSAPSRLLGSGRDWEAAMMAAVLARGYAVAISDYQGLGTPGDHAFMVGRALGRNVLDVIRAARALVPEELPDDGPAAILGYSEGGTAAGWAAQLQPTYAPELSLAGVAVGAATADLGMLPAMINGGPMSFFLAYTGIGFAAAYPDLELDRHLTPRAAKLITMLRSSSVHQAALWGPKFARAGHLTEPNVLGMSRWRTRMAENRLGGIAPLAPVMLYHSRTDHLVSYAQSERLLESWQSLGAEVHLHTTRASFDHISGAITGSPAALDWLAKRLDRWPFGTTAQQRSSRRGRSPRPGVDGSAADPAVDRAV